MNKFVMVTKNIGGFLKDNSPTILTGMSVAGLISTVGLAIKATPKAFAIKNSYQEDIWNVQDQIENGDISEESGKKEIRDDKIHLALDICKIYAPAAVSGVVTIACIVGAHSISMKRNAALAALYSISEKSLKEYKDKTKEIVGNSKAEKIEDELIKDKLSKNPLGKEYVIETGDGDTLCYDVYSGRYFKSDIEKIKQAINEFNQAMLYENSMSLNDFYGMLNLKHVRLGDNIGWTVDKFLEPSFRSSLASDMTPVLVLDYAVEPTWDYRVY